jgi:hypothetical protein
MGLQAEKLITLHVELGEIKAVGRVAGGKLAIIPIIGGTFVGERLRGRVCAGGADWSTAYSEKLVHVCARYWLETDDGAVISIENEGWLEDSSDAAIRTTPRFQCGLDGRYAFLNTGTYAGELRGAGDHSVDIVIWKLA